MTTGLSLGEALRVLLDRGCTHVYDVDIDDLHDIRGIMRQEAVRPTEGTYDVVGMTLCDSAGNVVWHACSVGEEVSP